MFNSLLFWLGVFVVSYFVAGFSSLSLYGAFIYSYAIISVIFIVTVACIVRKKIANKIIELDFFPTLGILVTQICISFIIARIFKRDFYFIFVIVTFAWNCHVVKYAEAFNKFRDKCIEEEQQEIQKEKELKEETKSDKQ